MKQSFLDIDYHTEKEAKLGLLASGYQPEHVDIYQEGDVWRMRLKGPPTGEDEPVPDIRAQHTVVLTQDGYIKPQPRRSLR